MIREPFEPPSVRDWALIIHADSSGERVDVYWVDINAGREGLRLAAEVKAWRRRDDLLTIGRRLRIAIPEPIANGGPIPPVVTSERDNPEAFVPDALNLVPDSPSCPSCRRPVTGPDPFCDQCSGRVSEPPPLPAREPVAPRSLDARHEYLAGRVRAILAHSETAGRALARAWPEGVSGLRNDGQSWEELDLILEAIERIEKDHSVPFYPEFVDPEMERAKREHPSNVWAMPKLTPATPDDRENIQDGIMSHPRSALIRRWIGYAIDGGIDHNIDTTALAHALSEFARIDETEWPDDDLTVMLDGSLRALGYVNGCEELGRFNPDHAPLLMSAAFAITAGNAYLLFGEDGKPIVRTNVRQS